MCSPTKTGTTIIATTKTHAVRFYIILFFLFYGANYVKKSTKNVYAINTIYYISTNLVWKDGQMLCVLEWTYFI